MLILDWPLRCCGDDEADIVMNDNLLIASITFETQKQD